MWKWKLDVEFQYGGRFGEFNGMSSQSHVSHCRVLPLGEFNVTIPEPHATLQGAVTWRDQCRDRATLQGVRIPSGILKIVFRYILFFLFLMQFRLWQAAAFVSSPIHLFITILCTNELLCAVYVNLMETQTSRTNFTTEQKVDFIIKVIEQQVSSTTFAVTSLWRAT